jgi:hypothetical protein
MPPQKLHAYSLAILAEGYVMTSGGSNNIWEENNRPEAPAGDNERAKSIRADGGVPNTPTIRSSLANPKLDRQEISERLREAFVDYACQRLGLCAGTSSDDALSAFLDRHGGGPASIAWFEESAGLISQLAQAAGIETKTALTPLQAKDLVRALLRALTESRIDWTTELGPEGIASKAVYYDGVTLRNATDKTVAEAVSIIETRVKNVLEKQYQELVPLAREILPAVVDEPTLSVARPPADILYGSRHWATLYVGMVVARNLGDDPSVKPVDELLKLGRAALAPVVSKEPTEVGEAAEAATSSPWAPKSVIAYMANAAGKLDGISDPFARAKAITDFAENQSQAEVELAHALVGMYQSLPSKEKTAERLLRDAHLDPDLKVVYDNTYTGAGAIIPLAGAVPGRGSLSGYLARHNGLVHYLAEGEGYDRGSLKAALKKLPAFNEAFHADVMEYVKSYCKSYAKFVSVSVSNYAITHDLDWENAKITILDTEFIYKFTGNGAFVSELMPERPTLVRNVPCAAYLINVENNGAQKSFILLTAQHAIGHMLEIPTGIEFNEWTHKYLPFLLQYKQIGDYEAAQNDGNEPGKLDSKKTIVAKSCSLHEIEAKVEAYYKVKADITAYHIEKTGWQQVLDVLPIVGAYRAYDRGETEEAIVSAIFDAIGFIGAVGAAAKVVRVGGKLALEVTKAVPVAFKAGAQGALDTLSHTAGPLVKELAKATGTLALAGLDGLNPVPLSPSAADLLGRFRAKDAAKIASELKAIDPNLAETVEKATKTLETKLAGQQTVKTISIDSPSDLARGAAAPPAGAPHGAEGKPTFGTEVTPEAVGAAEPPAASPGARETPNSPAPATALSESSESTHAAALDEVPSPSDKPSGPGRPEQPTNSKAEIEEQAIGPAGDDEISLHPELDRFAGIERGATQLFDKTDSSGLKVHRFADSGEIALLKPRAEHLSRTDSGAGKLYDRVDPDGLKPLPGQTYEATSSGFVHAEGLPGGGRKKPQAHGDGGASTGRPSPHQIHERLADMKPGEFKPAYKDDPRGLDYYRPVEGGAIVLLRKKDTYVSTKYEVEDLLKRTTGVQVFGRVNIGEVSENTADLLSRTGIMSQTYPVWDVKAKLVYQKSDVQIYKPLDFFTGKDVNGQEYARVTTTREIKTSAGHLQSETTIGDIIPLDGAPPRGLDPAIRNDLNRKQDGALDSFVVLNRKLLPDSIKESLKENRLLSKLSDTDFKIAKPDDVPDGRFMTLQNDAVEWSRADFPAKWRIPEAATDAGLPKGPTVGAIKQGVSVDAVGFGKKYLSAGAGYWYIIPREAGDHASGWADHFARIWNERYEHYGFGKAGAYDLGDGRAGIWAPSAPVDGFARQFGGVRYLKPSAKQAPAPSAIDKELAAYDNAAFNGEGSDEQLLGPGPSSSAASDVPTSIAPRLDRADSNTETPVFRKIGSGTGDGPVGSGASRPSTTSTIKLDDAKDGVDGARAGEGAPSPERVHASGAPGEQASSASVRLQRAEKGIPPRASGPVADLAPGEKVYDVVEVLDDGRRLVVWTETTGHQTFERVPGLASTENRYWRAEGQAGPMLEYDQSAGALKVPARGDGGGRDVPGTSSAGGSSTGGGSLHRPPGALADMKPGELRDYPGGKTGRLYYYRPPREEDVLLLKKVDSYLHTEVNFEKLDVPHSENLFLDAVNVGSTSKGVGHLLSQAGLVRTYVGYKTEEAFVTRQSTVDVFQAFNPSTGKAIEGKSYAVVHTVRKQPDFEHQGPGSIRTIFESKNVVPLNQAPPGRKRMNLADLEKLQEERASLGATLHKPHKVLGLITPDLTVTKEGSLGFKPTKMKHDAIGWDMDDLPANAAEWKAGPSAGRADLPKGPPVNAIKRGVSVHATGFGKKYLSAEEGYWYVIPSDAADAAPYWADQLAGIWNARYGKYNIGKAAAYDLGDGRAGIWVPSVPMKDGLTRNFNRVQELMPKAKPAPARPKPGEELASQDDPALTGAAGFEQLPSTSAAEDPAPRTIESGTSHRSVGPRASRQSTVPLEREQVGSPTDEQALPAPAPSPMPTGGPPAYRPPDASRFEIELIGGGMQVRLRDKSTGKVITYSVDTPPPPYTAPGADADSGLAASLIPPPYSVESPRGTARASTARADGAAEPLPGPSTASAGEGEPPPVRESGIVQDRAPGTKVHDVQEVLDGGRQLKVRDEATGQEITYERVPGLASSENRYWRAEGQRGSILVYDASTGTLKAPAGLKGGAPGRKRPAEDLGGEAGGASKKTFFEKEIGGWTLSDRHEFAQMERTRLREEGYVGVQIIQDENDRVFVVAHRLNQPSASEALEVTGLGQLELGEARTGDRPLSTSEIRPAAMITAEPGNTPHERPGEAPPSSSGSQTDPPFPTTSQMPPKPGPSHESGMTTVPSPGGRSTHKTGDEIIIDWKPSPSSFDTDTSIDPNDPRGRYIYLRQSQKFGKMYIQRSDNRFGEDYPTVFLELTGVADLSKAQELAAAWKTQGFIGKYVFRSDPVIWKNGDRWGLKRFVDPNSDAFYQEDTDFRGHFFKPALDYNYRREDLPEFLSPLAIRIIGDPVPGHSNTFGYEYGYVTFVRDLEQARQYKEAYDRLYPILVDEPATILRWKDSDEVAVFTVGGSEDAYRYVSDGDSPPRWEGLDEIDDGLRELDRATLSGRSSVSDVPANLPGPSELTAEQRSLVEAGRHYVPPKGYYVPPPAGHPAPPYEPATPGVDIVREEQWHHTRSYIEQRSVPVSHHPDVQYFNGLYLRFTPDARNEAQSWNAAYGAPDRQAYVAHVPGDQRPELAVAIPGLPADEFGRYGLPQPSTIPDAPPPPAYRGHYTPPPSYADEGQLGGGTAEASPTPADQGAAPMPGPSGAEDGTTGPSTPGTAEEELRTERLPRSVATDEARAPAGEAQGPVQASDMRDARPEHVPAIAAQPDGTAQPGLVVSVPGFSETPAFRWEAAIERDEPIVTVVGVQPMIVQHDMAFS